METRDEKVELGEAKLWIGRGAEDDRGFEAVFQGYWGTVYRILFRLLGDREQAEELSQEVFMKLYRQPPRLEENADLVPWLYRVATNLGYNALRSTSRELRRQERADWLSDPDRARGIDRDNPEAAWLAEEERKAVRKAVGQLTEREQGCLLLRHSGLSYAEVAAALGVQKSSVGTLLARAEEHFRNVYERDQGVRDVVHHNR